MLLKKLDSLSLILFTILFFIPIKNLLSQSTEWQNSVSLLNLATGEISFFHSDPNIMLTGESEVNYSSNNAGDIWEDFNNRVDSLSITNIDIGGNKIYAVTNSKSVWSTDLDVDVDDESLLYIVNY